MASFQDAGWLRRLWSLAAPGDPVVQYVQGVQLVNDMAYRSSRERAPYAWASNLLLAGGAGTHNFVELRGVDALGPTINHLHHARIELSSSATLPGLVRVVVADGAALTTATRLQVGTIAQDSDPDVAPQIFVGTILTANIPALASLLPHSGSVGQTGATPVFPNQLTELNPLKALPFAASWLGPRSLMFFGGDNEAMIFTAAWQALRG